jgi:hypothetical protein
MAKCDICQKTCNAHEMAPLLSIYRTDTVRDVCPECSRWADDQLWIIRDTNAPELRRRIAARVEKEQRPGFWRRLFRLSSVAPSL